MQGKVLMVLNTETSEVTYEVQGMLGTKCTEITEVLAQGTEVQEEQLTSEYCTEEEHPDYIDNLDN